MSQRFVNYSLHHVFFAAWILLIAVMESERAIADDESELSFSEYAASPGLTADEIYTVELLIDRVRSKFDSDYWDNESERSDARLSPNYKPAFSKDHIDPAAAELSLCSWVSFQRLGDRERPVRDLSALRYLPQLSGLVLINNDVSDLAPLGSCRNLRRLHLHNNPIRDISPLTGCVNLEELEVSNTPIEDFSVLKTLPKLRTLTISVDQLPVFGRMESFPNLTKLVIDGDTFGSFEHFPLMPRLRVIWGADVRSLNGLARFPKLQNLVNLSGGFDSLEPLRNSKNLTHVNIVRSRIDSLEPLAGLLKLHDFFLSTRVDAIDLEPLEGLPSLHEVGVLCAGSEPASVAKMRLGLSSWDVEFGSKTRRHTPSLKLEIVDQETFDVYDTQQPFGVIDAENEALLESELEWLDEQFEQVLAKGLVKEKDFTIPRRWGGARSRTVVLRSERAVADFPQLVLRIQGVLCRAKNDWIIYFQSSGVETDFIVWVYPQKIIVSHEHADVVRRLIKTE